MGERNDRLRRARIEAGFKRQRDVIEAHPGWNRNSYKSNENGNAPFSLDQAKVYAKAFGVRAMWLYDGEPPMRDAKIATVPLVGYVGAGAEAHFYEGADEGLGEVDAPDDSGPLTRAAEIRGDSLGPIFERWLIFYDDVRDPVSEDLIGELCIVGLPNGKVLIKRLRKAREEHHFHLESNTEGTMFDQLVSWAAKVKTMRPR